HAMAQVEQRGSVLWRAACHGVVKSHGFFLVLGLDQAQFSMRRVSLVAGRAVRLVACVLKPFSERADESILDVLTPFQKDYAVIHAGLLVYAVAGVVGL